MSLLSRNPEERLFRFTSKSVINSVDYIESYYYKVREVTYSNNILQAVNIEIVINVEAFLNEGRKTVFGVAFIHPYIPDQIQEAVSKYETLKKIS